MRRMSSLLKYLDELFPSPKSELNYNKDYELLIAIMLSAKSTDKRVNEVTFNLFNQYKTLDDLSKAKLKDIEHIIHSVGTYHVKAKNIILIANKIKEYGYIPNDKKILLELPGVGIKTASLVLNLLYGEPYIAVDTHVARVSRRLGLVNQNDNISEIQNKLDKLIDDNIKGRVHLQMVLFGRYYCKAKKPLCDNCKFNKICKKRINY